MEVVMGKTLKEIRQELYLEKIISSLGENKEWFSEARIQGMRMWWHMPFGAPRRKLIMEWFNQDIRYETSSEPVRLWINVKWQWYIDQDLKYLIKKGKLKICRENHGSSKGKKRIGKFTSYLVRTDK